jgi:exodeoxyribonuclease V gamma subunit
VLHVHRSERADRLVEGLGDVLADPLDDPLTAEVVAVPTRGVERWLVQRLGHRLGTSGTEDDGVCANVQFPFPGVLVGRAAAAACGVDTEHDPWAPERSVWPLMEVVDASMAEPWMRMLADHLTAAFPSDQGEPVRRFTTLRHLADLFDRYGVHRPELLRAWAAGDNAARGPGFVEGVWSWQPELWRRLRERIGLESPAERLDRAARRLAAEPALVDLPTRISLFGLTRLPASYLTVLDAIAVGREVHLFLLHPSAALWDKVQAVVPRPLPASRRADDPTAAMPAHPLLRSWGRDSREMQLVLAVRGGEHGDHRPVVDDRTTLLGRIQADIRADRSPPLSPIAGQPDPRPLLADSDHSLRVHACHGRGRQVEVTRDAILHLLSADPTLEPRDVIVMCPDIETFAPLVHAAFGAADQTDSPAGPLAGADLPRLRVRLADRSLRQVNPLLSVAEHLLELSSSRVTASQVLDLASMEPVRRRFELDDDDLSQIESWVGDMGVRWGLDAPHRQRWGLAAVEANTWSAGLDRLMLGVTMADEGERQFAGAVPLDDMGSGSVDLAGRFAELVARLRIALVALGRPQTAEAWAEALGRSTDSLAAPAPAEEWQRDQLHAVLDEVVQEACGRGPGGGTSPSLGLFEARALLAHRLRGRPTRANFRTGDLTVCTLVPMRSVPHRVTCLLGLDDGLFPRRPEQDGDDLLLRDPRVGDPDSRSEDRQLLLDAVLAATDHLVITYRGRDECSNHPRPPAVPVAELLDVVDRTVRTDDGRPARDAVIVEHPLQSFDPRNFSPGKLGHAGSWSFDTLSLDGARALTRPRREAGPLVPGPLPAVGGDVVQLESVVRFVEHPVRSFLRERLGIYAGRLDDKVDDTLPIALDGLEKWEVADRLLNARLVGASLDDAVNAERARGLLPPGALADQVVDELAPTIEALLAVSSSLECASIEPASMEVNLTLPDGRQLVGSVPGVRGATILRCLYSSLGAKHRLASWVRCMALSASRPELPVAAVTIGRGRRRRGEQLIRVSQIPPLAGDPGTRRSLAVSALCSVMELFDQGMREPLPLFCVTSSAWAEARRAGSDHDDAAAMAREKWEGSYSIPGEHADPEHVLVLGRRYPFESVLRHSPGLKERAPGWVDSEPHRFGRLARYLWEPVLLVERLEER